MAELNKKKKPLASIEIKKIKHKEDLLGDTIVEGVENGGELLDEVRAVASLLELINDADNDVVVDALGIDPRRKAIVHGRGRWRVLPGGAAANSGALLGGRLWR